MKALRYLFASIVFLFVWVLVAAVVSLVINLVSPPSGGGLTVSVGTSSRDLPGTLIGLLAGVFAFRVVVKGRKRSAS